MKNLNRLFAALTVLGGTSSILSAQEAGSSGGGESVGVVGLLIYLAIIILVIAGFWKMFTKAGKPGWASLIPIYNVIVMLEIAGRPIWWIILFFIPVVGAIMGIILAVDIAKVFGHGVGFALGLIFLPFIFYPILGFGSSQYTG